MHFDIIGGIRQIEIIAAGLGVRERKRLWKAYGRGSWRKLKVSQTLNFRMALW